MAYHRRVSPDGVSIQFTSHEEEVMGRAIHTLNQALQDEQMGFP